MCCCSVGISVMRSCAVFVSQTRCLSPSFSRCSFIPLPSTSRKHCVRPLRLVVSQSRPHCPLLSNRGSSPAFSPPPTEVPVSSVLCLSSVRELPVQVRDLYAQGFVLVAVHPFVHPCGPRHARIQRQLHRAVLVRETPRYSSTNKDLAQYACTILELLHR